MASFEFEEPAFQQQGELSDYAAQDVTVTLMSSGQKLGGLIAKKGLNTVYGEAVARIPTDTTRLVTDLTTTEYPREEGANEDPRATAMRKGIIIGMKFGDILPVSGDVHRDHQLQTLQEMKRLQQRRNTPDHWDTPDLEDIIRPKDYTNLSRTVTGALPPNVFRYGDGRRISDVTKSLFANSVLYFARIGASLLVAQKGQRAHPRSRRAMSKEMRRLERPNDAQVDEDIAAFIEANKRK